MTDNRIKKLLPTQTFKWDKRELRQKVYALFYSSETQELVFSQEEWHPVLVNEHGHDRTILQDCGSEEGFVAISPNSHHTIEFDGGTTCNDPKLGFGKGYGSFQIDGGQIHRVEFGTGHSSNSAEILTLEAALQMLASCGNPKEMTVLARGDSQIALKWVHCRANPKASTSESFRQAIPLLRAQVERFKSIRTQWRGRAHSVALFGH